MRLCSVAILSLILIFAAPSAHIQYKHGSRGKRMIALGLAGDTKISAHVTFVDKATGKLLLEADVDGQVYTGLLGGSPDGAPTGVGKDIAKIAKKVFF